MKYKSIKDNIRHLNECYKIDVCEDFLKNGIKKVINKNTRLQQIGSEEWIVFTEKIKMTIEEKQQSPILEIKSPNLQFGSIKQGSRVRGQAIIKNNGQKPLEIRRVINNNSNVLVHPMRLSIKGGKTGELKIDIDTKTLPQGDYKKSFTIQTNDPENSFLIYTLSWTVKK